MRLPFGVSPADEPSPFQVESCCCIIFPAHSTQIQTNLSKFESSILFVRLKTVSSNLDQRTLSTWINEQKGTRWNPQQLLTHFSSVSEIFLPLPMAAHINPCTLKATALVTTSTRTWITRANIKARMLGPLPILQGKPPFSFRRSLIPRHERCELQTGAVRSLCSRAVAIEINTSSTPNPNALKFMPPCDVTGTVRTISFSKVCSTSEDGIHDILLSLQGVSRVSSVHLPAMHRILPYAPGCRGSHSAPCTPTTSRGST